MVLAFTWADFAQQVVSGLSIGGVYASLALAIVIIYRSTGVINFAQGEMAMFATFIAFSLMHHMSYWPAFVLTLVIAFGGGVALERIVIRPVESSSVLTIVIVTLGLAGSSSTAPPRGSGAGRHGCSRARSRRGQFVSRASRSRSRTSESSR
jgi:Branched-chain amino acid ABC-type transport system, permease components